MAGLVQLGVVWPPAPEPPSDPQTDREQLLAEAYALLGTPYEWGAKGPAAYDCSGFTKAAYAAIGVSLPDGSFNQAEGARPLTSADELQPGDLLFYRHPAGSRVSHVTMYFGDGWVIGTGSRYQPAEVTLYLLSSDLSISDCAISYRHVVLPDER